jgi:excisionase family DNA binding protein
MTTKELAAYLKVHEVTVCKYASKGTIPAIRVGRIWRFDRDEIDEWIANGSRMRKEEQHSSNAPDAIKK